MAQPIVPAQPSFPHIDRSIDPKISRHLQQLYTAINAHDKAIILVNNKAAGTTPAASTAATTTVDQDIVPITTGGGVAGVTSFNSMAGDVSFFPSLGAVNDQTLSTFYVTQTSDNGVLIVLDSAAPFPVTLNFNVVKPWYTWIANYGAGLATLTPSQGTITYPGNIGAVSMPLPSGFAAYIGFDGTNWWAVAIPIQGGGGTITGVTAGTGLTGGGSSGSVTLALNVPVSIANGGTGTATPGLVAGTNVTITGAWPNQTVNSTSGAGVTQLVAGSNIVLSPSGGTGVVTVTSTTGGTTTAIQNAGLAASRSFTSAVFPDITPPTSPNIFQNTGTGVMIVTMSADLSGAGFHGVVYCDSSPSPLTVIAQFARVNAGSGPPNYYPASVTFVVPSLYYYGIVVTSGSGLPEIRTWTEWEIA